MRCYCGVRCHAWQVSNRIPDHEKVCGGDMAEERGERSWKMAHYNILHYYGQIWTLMSWISNIDIIC